MPRSRPALQLFRLLQAPILPQLTPDLALRRSSFPKLPHLTVIWRSLTRLRDPNPNNARNSPTSPPVPCPYLELFCQLPAQLPQLPPAEALLCGHTAPRMAESTTGRTRAHQHSNNWTQCTRLHSCLFAATHCKPGPASRPDHMQRHNPKRTKPPCCHPSHPDVSRFALTRQSTHPHPAVASPPLLTAIFTTTTSRPSTLSVPPGPRPRPSLSPYGIHATVSPHLHLSTPAPQPAFAPPPPSSRPHPPQPLAPSPCSAASTWRSTSPGSRTRGADRWHCTRAASRGTCTGGSHRCRLDSKVQCSRCASVRRVRSARGEEGAGREAPHERRRATRACERG